MRYKSRRNAEGRLCPGCRCMDYDKAWSKEGTLCRSCDRYGNRYGLCSCGSPLWHERNGQPLHCMADCGAPVPEYPFGAPPVYPTHWVDDDETGTGSYPPTPGHIPHSPATPSAEPPETTGQHNATMPRVVSPTEGEAETA